MALAAWPPDTVLVGSLKRVPTLLTGVVRLQVSAVTGSLIS